MNNTATRKIGVNMIFPGKQIALNRIGSAEISTVELPRLGFDAQVRYETCIFYDHSPSNVVAQYDTAEEAHKAHNRIVEHELMHEWTRNNLESKQRFQDENPDFMTYLQLKKLAEENG
jgi:hypothetical protein